MKKSVGSSPGHPFKILKLFFLHFVRECEQGISCKFGQFDYVFKHTLGLAGAKISRVYGTNSSLYRASTVPTVVCPRVWSLSVSPFTIVIILFCQVVLNSLQHTP